MYDDTFPTALVVLGFAAFAAFVVIAIVLTLRAQQKRREALLQLALQLGAEFYAEDHFNIDSRADWREEFSQGHSRRVSNVISGRMDDWDLKTCDFHYKTGSGKNESSHSVSAILLDTGLLFPTLTIRPETVFDRIAGVVGYNDIDFESDEFSRKFFVRSADKRFAYGIVHPKMMEFLLADPKWSLRLSWQSLILHNNRILTPEEFRYAIDLGRSFLKLMPDYLREELRKTQETV
ncbi:MAG: hypothetical protein Q7T82_11760 [Armatimonadota bacterium]|nr:hypothetical protein [Armatimonadota bacterium]